MSRVRAPSQGQALILRTRHHTLLYDAGPRSGPVDLGARVVLPSLKKLGVGQLDMMLLSQATNLERIHEFHVVLGQSGLMKWCETPYSYLALTKQGRRAFEDYTDALRGLLGEPR